MPTTLTRHGRERLDERVNLSSRAAERMAAKAHDEGITRSETTGDLHRWMAATEGDGKVYARIYGAHVYLFGDGCTLITALHLPKEYHKAAIKISKAS